MTRKVKALIGIAAGAAGVIGALAYRLTGKGAPYRITVTTDEDDAGYTYTRLTLRRNQRQERIDSIIREVVDDNEARIFAD
jgi:hypothetical protein